jgi:hypothetical protein
MGFLLSLFTGGNAKLIGIGLIVLAIGGAFTWQWFKLTMEHEARVTAEAQVTTISAQLDTAVQANKTNQETIRQMQADQERSADAVKTLESLKAKDAVTINTLKSAINIQKNNPLNKVELSPVLQLTVDAIQQARSQRQAELDGAKQ